MKSIFVTVLACVVALEAKPKPYMGLSGPGIGLGTAMGTGLDPSGIERLGLGKGLGLGRRASEYSQGGSFGDNQFNGVSNGFENQGYHSGGFKNFHDIGHHHNSLTSITHAENSDDHDVGGSQAFDTGAQSNTRHNQFGNGRSRFVRPVLACVVALEAKPKPYMGLSGPGIGLGTAMGTGLDPSGIERLGLGKGLGLGRRASEYSQGGSFGDNQFNVGSNGFENQGYHSGGFKNFHDVGHHHNSLTSITHAENSDDHDVGGSQAFDTGAQSNTRHNQFGNGRSRFGNNYENGRQMISFL